MQHRKPPPPPLPPLNSKTDVNSFLPMTLRSRLGKIESGGASGGAGVLHAAEDGYAMSSSSVPRRAASTLTSQQQQQHASKCACGLPNAKFCMLFSMIDKLQTSGKPHRQITWVPMSICST